MRIWKGVIGKILRIIQLAQLLAQHLAPTSTSVHYSTA